MKLIIIDNKRGKNRAANANALVVALALAGLLGIPGAAGYFGYRFGVERTGLTSELVDRWHEILGDQQRAVDEARSEAELALDTSELRLAQLRARMMRLDALGERLIRIGGLDEGEFDFTQPPALGGPENPASISSYQPPAYMDALSSLAEDISDREQQLIVLESLLMNRNTQRDVFLAGSPIKKGWVSSRYGYRNDPVTGKRAWHNGVDFAGREGSDVVAVAAGVVVFAGDRFGYGRMVEINHGSGYSTRYGHHKELTVKAGDIVRKGEVVGLMGSSGRSTGPHVHFEVFKNGRVVDPFTYIHRASR